MQNIWSSPEDMNHKNIFLIELKPSNFALPANLSPQTGYGMNNKGQKNNHWWQR